MREKIQPQKQASYWNSISTHYQTFTKIDVSDFHYGPQIPGERDLHLLPTFKKGMRALELGCGAAQNSIWLAKQGLVCTAMDISQQQIEHAQKLCQNHQVDVRLKCAGFETFETQLSAREHFDLIHTSHAMEFVENPFNVIQAMAGRLRRGGVLMISTVHPLYNGEWTTFEVFSGKGRRPREVDGLFLTHYFEPPDDIRDEEGQHVISRAYPLSSWFRWLKAAGLQIESFEEPAAIVEAPYSSPDWADHGGQLDAIPSTVIWVARRR